LSLSLAFPQTKTVIVSAMAKGITTDF
jgi:hypothetical protein